MRKLVLVADDYDHSAELMADLIESATPFDAVWAQDGQTAFSLTLARRPDACILALDMPVVDGAATARAIITAFDARRPLLIALAERPEDLSADVRGLFDHVLAKPIDVPRLLALLTTL